MMQTPRHTRLSMCRLLPMLCTALLCMGLGHTANAQCGTYSSQGNDFWLTFLNNYTIGHQRNLTLLIAGPPGARVLATNPNTQWADSVEIPISGNTLIQVPDEEAYLNTSLLPLNAGIHVTATANIALYASNYVPNTYDIAMVFPTPALRTRYMAQTYSSPDAEIAVVALQDSTLITLTELDSLFVFLADTVAGTYAYDTIHVTRTMPMLMRGQVGYLGWTDFTGALVTSNDKPFALFQGNRCTRVANCAACDHLFEQAPPSEFWGTHFLLVPTAGRILGDYVRITSLEDDCEVYVDSVLRATLQRGETYNMLLPSGDVAQVLTSTRPVSVCLYFIGHRCEHDSYTEEEPVGDPSSVIIPPLEQRLTNVTFHALNTANTVRHHVCIICRTVDLPHMMFNGSPIGSVFTQASNGYSFARIPLTAGVHSLSNVQGGLLAYFYGLGGAESYAYIVGMATHNLNYHLYVDDHDVRTHTGLFSYCQGDTADLRVALRGRPDTSLLVHWHIDTTFYRTTHDTLRLPLDMGGWHNIHAVVGTCDTLTARLYIHPHRYDSIVELVCDEGQYLFVDTLVRTSGTYTRIFNDTLRCTGDSLLLITFDTTARTALADSFCFDKRYFWKDRSLDTPGTYTDSLSSASGCDSIVTLDLSVIPRPHIAIRATDHCRDGSYTLRADLAPLGNPSSRWAALPPDPTLDGHEANSTVEVHPLHTTLYTLDVDWQCPFFETLLLRPLQTVSADIKVLPETATFDSPWLDLYSNDPQADSSEWLIDGTEAGWGDHLRHLADMMADSTYIRLVAHNGPCSDTAFLSVRHAHIAVWAPNTFTPDGDANNIFSITLRDATADELYIYNRFGALVHHTATPGDGWDGTHHGTPCQQGAYVWLLVYRTAEQPESIKKMTGTVTLLR